jgi:hypothetical protein
LEVDAALLMASTKPKTVKMAASAFSVMETDVWEFRSDKDDPELSFIAEFVDWDRQRLVIPDGPVLRDKLFSALIELSNTYDDMAEYKLSHEDPRFLRNAARSLGTLAGKVL